MLALLRRIGTEFGIAVLVTSHLLGELEQICDHVVVIDGGRLLRAGATDSFTQSQPDRCWSRSTSATADAGRCARPPRPGAAAVRPGACSSSIDRRAHLRRGPGHRRRPRARRWPGWSSAGTGSRRCSAAELAETPATPATTETADDRGDPCQPTSCPPASSTTSATSATTVPGYGRGGHRRALSGDSLRPPSGSAGAAESKIVPMPCSLVDVPARADHRAVVGRPGGGSRAFAYDTYAYPAAGRDHDDLRRRPGARAGLARPAPPGAPALLRPAAAPGRLPAGQAGRADRGLPDRAGRAAAPAVRRARRRRARRRCRSGPRPRRCCPAWPWGCCGRVVLAGIALVIASCSGRRAFAAGGVASLCS